MSAPAYVSPADMLSLFPEPELIEVTNLRDSAAQEVNPARLQAACDGANGIAYGYLATRFHAEALTLETLPEGFLGAFKMHCANIARDILDGSITEVRAKAEEARTFFQTFSGPAGSSNNDATPGVQGGERFGTIVTAPGRQYWNETRLTHLFGSSN
jgi:phage gp36-like protein